MEWSGNTRYAARFYQTRSSPPGLPCRSSILPEQRGTTGGQGRYSPNLAYHYLLT